MACKMLDLVKLDPPRRVSRVKRRGASRTFEASRNRKDSVCIRSRWKRPSARTSRSRTRSRAKTSQGRSRPRSSPRWHRIGTAGGAVSSSPGTRPSRSAILWRRSSDGSLRSAKILDRPTKLCVSSRELRKRQWTTRCDIGFPTSARSSRAVQVRRQKHECRCQTCGRGSTTTCRRARSLSCQILSSSVGTRGRRTLVGGRRPLCEFAHQIRRRDRRALHEARRRARANSVLRR